MRSVFVSRQSTLDLGKYRTVLRPLHCGAVVINDRRTLMWIREEQAVQHNLCGDDARGLCSAGLGV